MRTSACGRLLRRGVIGLTSLDPQNIFAVVDTGNMALAFTDFNLIVIRLEQESGWLRVGAFVQDKV